MSTLETTYRNIEMTKQKDKKKNQKKAKNVESERSESTAGTQVVLDVLNAVCGTGDTRDVFPASAAAMATPGDEEVAQLDTHDPRLQRSHDHQTLSSQYTMSPLLSTTLAHLVISNPVQKRMQSTRPSTSSAFQIQRAVSEPQANSSWQTPLTLFRSRGSQDEVTDEELWNLANRADVIVKLLSRMEDRLECD